MTFTDGATTYYCPVHGYVDVDEPCICRAPDLFALAVRRYQRGLLTTSEYESALANLLPAQMIEDLQSSRGQSHPARIDTWYDRSLRSWRTILTDLEYNQIGDAAYDGTRADRDASRKQYASLLLIASAYASIIRDDVEADARIDALATASRA